MSNQKEQKKKGKASGRILTLLIIVCLCVIGFSAYKLISLKLAYRVGEKEYKELLEYTEPADLPEGEEVIDDYVEENENDDQTPVHTKKAAPIKVNFQGLKEINPDVVAWIYIEALDLSYPVVQGRDNDYYLHRTFAGTDNFAGSIFIDADNASDFSDLNTIVYGHNMKNLSMFGKLKQLQSKELYKENDTFWILTPEENYCYQMFDITVVSTSDRLYTLFEVGGMDWVEYLLYCKGISQVPLDRTDFSEETKVVTLSTCTNAGSTRFVVQGALMED